MDKKINILLVDDHQVVIDGLCLIINSSEKFQVLGFALNGAEAIVKVKEESIDIILMDINMPVMNGLEATKAIRQFDTHVKILGLSMLDEIAIVKHLRQAGGNGFLLKNSGKEEILTALNEVLTNGSYYDKHIIERLISDEPKSNSIIPNLSRREKEILKLIIDEYTTKEIAEKLFISFGTVETHRRNIINKLGVRNTAGLVRMAVEYKLV